MALENFGEIDKLNERLNELLKALDGHAPESDEYAKIVDQLNKLMKIKEMIGNLHLKADEALTKRMDNENQFEVKKRELALKEKESEKPDRVSKEAWAMIAANLVGIGMIIGYERVNIIASKALGFVLRAR